MKAARLAVLGLLAGCAVCSASNIVTNAGFETGDLSGWLTNLNDWGVDTNPHSGSYNAFTACSGSPVCLDYSSGSYLYQDLATEAGGVYALSFWYNSGFLPTNGTELDVYWGGTKIASFVNVDTSNAYVQDTVTGLIANSNTTRLEFTGRQDPGAYSLDDVAVVIPDIGTAWMLVSGMLGVSAYGFRRHRCCGSSRPLSF